MCNTSKRLNGYIVQKDFQGVIESKLNNGVTEGGLTWADYLAKNQTQKNQFILCTGPEVDALFEKSNQDKYLSQPPKIVTEQRYHEMLDVLPAENWVMDYGVDQFRISEYQTGTITTQFGSYDGIYLEKYIDVKNRTTWLKISDFKNLAKTKNAKRVLSLMDELEDGCSRFPEFVKQVSSESGVSVEQIIAEISPFI